MYVHGLCHPAQVSSPMTDMNVILFLGENLLVSHLNCFNGVVATLAADYNDDQNYHRRKSNKVVLLREVFIMVSSAHSLELLPFRSAARKQDKMNSNSSRHRINAALMPKYHGRQVCLLGKAKDVDPNGTYFTLTSSDGRDVRITLNEPLSEYVAGLTEVHGVVQGNSIICDNYVLFSEEASNKFDMVLYNQAVEMMEKAADYYIQGVEQE